MLVNNKQLSSAILITSQDDWIVSKNRALLCSVFGWAAPRPTSQPTVSNIKENHNAFIKHQRNSHVLSALMSVYCSSNVWLHHEIKLSIIYSLYVYTTLQAAIFLLISAPYGSILFIESPACSISGYLLPCVHISWLQQVLKYYFSTRSAYMCNFHSYTLYPFGQCMVAR